MPRLRAQERGQAPSQTTEPVPHTPVSRGVEIRFRGTCFWTSDVTLDLLDVTISRVSLGNHSEHTPMTGEEKLRVSRETIAEFCRKWKIMEFALFGSVLRADFSPDSDVDVLVTFNSCSDWDYEHLLRMKAELESLFERPIDLVQRQQIESSDNYIRRKHILTNLETVYVA